MSKTISKIMEHSERNIVKIISKLEEKNGYPSHDVRLTSDNIQKVRSKIVELNLDPNDTTAEELYHALLIKFQSDARRFDEHFGLHQADFDAKIVKAAELVSNNVDLPDKWVLKTSAAKALLRQHPPKKTMRQLGYRSIDSLLKRENLYDTYLAVEYIESPSWNKAHFKLAAGLGTTAFERRSIHLSALGANKWGIDHTDKLAAYSNDYGVLGVLPKAEFESASLLGLVVALLDELSVFGPIDISELTLKLSPAAAWWSETDSLVAELNGQPVSLNLKDVAHSHLLSAAFSDRINLAGQKSFWKELLSRYDNQLVTEGDNLPQLKNPLTSISGVFNQPAFEYVEDV